MLLLPPGQPNTEQLQDRTPSPLAVKTVEIYSEALRNGESITKGEAMRQAGYSDRSSEHPEIVFSNPYVRALCEKVGLTESAAMEAVKRNLNARRSNHAIFPPYNPEKALEYETRTGEDGVDRTEISRGAQMTDEDIREHFTLINCQVHRIVHGDQARHVYFYSHDSKAQLDAAKLAFELHGSFAPKKSEVKATVGVFALSKLRRQMEEGGVKIIEHANQNGTGH